MLTSLESKFFYLVFKIASDGWKGQSGVIKNLGPVSQELSKREFADRLPVPASARVGARVGTVNVSVFSLQLILALMNGIVISHEFGRSAAHWRNFSQTSSGRLLSNCYPLRRQMSSNKRRAVTVYGATRPMGSYTADTKQRTTRCITSRFKSAVFPLLTTKVSGLWFHFKPNTSEVSSFVTESFSVESVGSWCFGSTLLTKVSTLLTILVSWKPPFAYIWRRSWAFLVALMTVGLDTR